MQKREAGKSEARCEKQLKFSKLASELLVLSLSKPESEWRFPAYLLVA